jgi:hypothetical protein
MIKYMRHTLFVITGGVMLLIIIPAGCRKNENTEVPVLSTTPVTNITETSALSGGEISDDGGSKILFRGVCWSTGTMPVTTGHSAYSGSGPGNYSSLITALQPGTKYYVRAFAKNSAGVSYGQQEEFTTLERKIDTSFFPVAVWLQSPSNAAAYRDKGINMFVGLWNGLDQSQLNLLRNANMKVICSQNAFGLSNLSDTLIYGWMHGDEPDNAQWNESLQRYDPCIDPAIIVSDYQQIRQNDPSRPVYLNLGQGVAYTNYVGRGACRNNTGMYVRSNNGYLAGCDIGSFDIYPMNNTDAETKGNLWYVAKGIDNLLSWSDHSIPVWCWIETTKIHETSFAQPTPSQVRSEVWMALIHGASGFGYFCHSWTPSFDEAALLHDATMIQAVKEINEQVASLASVLNSPALTGYATVSSSNAQVPVDIMSRNYGDFYYVFAVAMRDGSTNATFTVSAGTRADVLGEGRSLNIAGGTFTDAFVSFGVHLYRITP